MSQHVQSGQGAEVASPASEVAAAAPAAAPSSGAASPSAQTAPSPPGADAGGPGGVDAGEQAGHGPPHAFYSTSNVFINSTAGGWSAQGVVSQPRYKTLSWTKVVEQVKEEISIESELRASPILKARRLLVISGASGLGKATSARAIICDTAKEQGVTPDVLLFDDPDAASNLSIDDWTADPSYHNHVLLLKDAFSGASTNLRRSGRRLQREHLDQLTNDLHSKGMFVVLTSGEDALPTEWKAANIHYPMTAPSKEVLRRHLDKEIDRIANKPRYGSPPLKIDEGQRQELLEKLEKLGTIPRLIVFSDQYFEEIALRRITVEMALRNFEAPTQWFLRGLRDSAPAAWCLAFATCLLQADPTLKPVPWSLAMRLADVIARRLCSCIPSWRGKQPQFLDPDEELLHSARMVIELDEHRGCDCVRFRDDTYPDKLWKALVDAGRGLLSMICPVLATLAERQSELWLPTMTILGRISAIDTIPHFDRYMEVLVKAPGPDHHLALGRFLAGVLASGNTAGWERCKAWLRSRAESIGPRPFMLAMYEVGRHDLALAVREMIGVAERRIRPHLPGFAARHRLRSEAIATLRSAIGTLNDGVARTASIDRETGESLREAFGQLFDNGIEDLLEATVGLCLAHNPVEVCITFLPHIAVDTMISVSGPNPVVGCIVAMLFFADARDAVFSVLGREEYKARASEPGPDGPKISLVALGLASDPAGLVGPFARFLSDSFDALAALPRPVGSPMQAQLVRCVKMWIRDASRNRRTTPAIKELLCQLRDHKSSLSAALMMMLRSDEDFRKPGSPLRTLAVDILTFDSHDK
jgi:hypothetical protein